MSDYQERKQAKIDRYRELSESNSKKSTQASEESRKMVEVIPMGQPILVGHHSERGHRNLLDKSWNKMGKSVELQKKSDYYSDKADAAENNTAISSDDPEAVTKMETKIAAAEHEQKFMKASNRIMKSKTKSDLQKVEEIMALGVSEETAKEGILPDRYGRFGFPSYMLTNNNANIRRMKLRLKDLEQRAIDSTKEWEFNGVKVIDNVEDNRLQLFFDGKPSDDVRSSLKHSAFRWSPRNGCWQSYRNRYQNSRAEVIISTLGEDKVNLI